MKRPWDLITGLLIGAFLYQVITGKHDWEMAATIGWHQTLAVALAHWVWVSKKEAS